jgi:hypothetical protein
MLMITPTIERVASSRKPGMMPAMNSLLTEIPPITLAATIE